MALLHAVQSAGALQAVHQHARNDGTHCSGDEERHDVGIERDVAGALAHEEDGHRVSAQAAQNAGAEHLAHHGGKDVFGLMVHKAAQQCAEHAAGEGHQAAQTQQVAQQRGHEGHADAVVGAQQHSAQDVDHVLHRGAFAAKNGEAEHAAHHTQSAQHTGQRQLFHREFFHKARLLSKPAEAAKTIQRLRKQPAPGARPGAGTIRSGRDFLVSSHAGTRLPIADGHKAQGAPPQPAAALPQKSTRHPP